MISVKSKKNRRDQKQLTLTKLVKLKYSFTVKEIKVSLLLRGTTNIIFCVMIYLFFYVIKLLT